ncbi:MAG: alpha-hydroxy-acid oxidizing protein [Clostridiales bacterium]|jgi:isopentenyl diphosphate isomerase/L-lactate dehydrogenase-like FMN-dependent dehydrogenase|nr:alpha-hydroxy-acid oxidizing protein [Clostridiales bacterium]
MNILRRQILNGDSDRITREYFDSLLVEMRHIDAVEPSTEFSVYGETFSTPATLAALSHLDNVRPNGLVEMAKGLKAVNALMFYGMGEDTELEEIAATGVKVIKIIKPHADNKEVIRRIKHAESVGALAVGMDVDHAFGSKNARGQVLNLPMTQKTLEDIKLFVNSTNLPFIVKGVLSERDARKCVEAGAGGVVVSHHHGLLDYAAPPLMILRRIVSAINGKMPIFVDCGISSGMDVFKALALGADAACVGRAAIGPLKSSGADGVGRLFMEITNELNWAMAVTCSADIKHIDPTVIWFQSTSGRDPR